MATYLVQKRTVLAEGDVFAGAVLELDPDDNATTLLMQRGFIVPVSSDYKSPATPETTPDPAPDPEAATSGGVTGGDTGGDQTPPASGEGDDAVDDAESDDYKSLMAMTRDKLDADASDLGIQGAEAMANKDKVARAILDKLNDQ